MGVTEQNLMGTTAGLAAAGRIPFAFAFAVFVSMRALEPIRTSICYPRLSAKLIGATAALSNGKDGATHQSIEDIAIMRSCRTSSSYRRPIASCPPRSCVPSTPTLARHMFGSSTTPVSPRVRAEPFTIGRGYIVREGRDVTIVSYGTAVARALAAARVLAGSGIDVEVLDMPSLKPFDADLLLKSARKTGALITLEGTEVHRRSRGDSVATAHRGRLPSSLPCPRHSDVFPESGRSDELRVKFGVDEGAVVRAVHELTSSASR